MSKMLLTLQNHIEITTFMYENMYFEKYGHSSSAFCFLNQILVCSVRAMYDFLQKCL